MKKKHENPEFQVIKMDLANAKFYAASVLDDTYSGGQGTTTPTPTSTPATNGYGLSNSNGWF